MMWNVADILASIVKEFYFYNLCVGEVYVRKNQRNRAFT